MVILKLLCHENKSTESEPPLKEVKGEGLTSCDAITNSSRQSNLDFIIETVYFMHFIKADHYVGFYELFVLWREVWGTAVGTLDFPQYIFLCVIHA
jgi:hypothetical protein